jgi:hypothetical protein
VAGPAGDEGDAAEAEALPDLPPSWVPELAVSRGQLDMRCPRVRRGRAWAWAVSPCSFQVTLRVPCSSLSLRTPSPSRPLLSRRAQGTRVTLFHRCQAEIFARFGECSRWDGLVQRVTAYADDDRTVPTEVRAPPPPALPGRAPALADRHALRCRLA